MDSPCSLPEDLLLEILLRLPVESLLRFKCVCKCWYALIKSLSFITKHFSHKSNRAHLFVYNNRSGPTIPSIIFSLLSDEIVPGVTPKHKTLIQCPQYPYFTSIIGPVDGLFLVKKSRSQDEIALVLWNPATREFRPLPPAPLKSEHDDYDDEIGFGLDLLSQDYKVVWVRQLWNGGQRSAAFVCVYSFRNNSWKNLIPDFHLSCGLLTSLNATYLNGVYYWLCEHVDEVISFDMGTEKFGTIRGPVIKWGKLTLHGDSLAILAGEIIKTSIFDIWLMNQESSWTKVHTIRPPTDDRYIPRGICEKDKMIYIRNETSQLVVYDPTTREITDLEFELDIHLDCLWVLNYKESLFTLERRNYIDNEVDQLVNFFSTAQASVANSSNI